MGADLTSWSELFCWHEWYDILTLSKYKFEVCRFDRYKILALKSRFHDFYILMLAYANVDFRSLRGLSIYQCMQREQQRWFNSSLISSVTWKITFLSFMCVCVYICIFFFFRFLVFLIQITISLMMWRNQVFHFLQRKGYVITV